MDELTAQSVAYRSGEVSYANFYNYLQGVCSKAGVSLQSFPAMREYIQYVLLADGITAETLFDDLMSLERMAYSKLAKTPEAMAAVKKARSAYLTGKLVDFSLTPEEWKEYRSSLSRTKAFHLLRISIEKPTLATTPWQKTYSTLFKQENLYRCRSW